MSQTEIMHLIDTIALFGAALIGTKLFGGLLNRWALVGMVAVTTPVAPFLIARRISR